MNITIKRPPITNSDTTISELYINDVLFCHVLEDKDRNLSTDRPDEVRALKIKHQTAIPYGSYEVVLGFSNRFQKVLPLLLRVPEFDGIRIHAGNTKEDTSGCLLVGDKVSDSKIANSRATMLNLMAILKKALKSEKVILTVVPNQNNNSLT